MPSPCTRACAASRHGIGETAPCPKHARSGEASIPEKPRPLKVLLFTGAGASVELGVPAMRRMVEEFHVHLSNQELSEDIFDRIDRLLANAEYDMENLVDLVDGMDRGREADKPLGREVDEALRATVGIIRGEAQWFVQHACERVKESHAARLWGPGLRRIGEHQMVLATTNYDRAIELACASLGVEVDDGFNPFEGQEYAVWKGTEDGGQFQLIKVHGSTDWYQGSYGSVFKLRHPMPLFGDLSVSVGGPGPPNLKSALILPARGKDANTPPYPDLATAFRKAATSAELAIFLGTSLRDPDIRDICTKCAAQIPTFYVSVTGPGEGSSLPPKARHIKQTASEFLISTLPRFLEESNVTVLDAAADHDPYPGKNVLEWVVSAFGDDESPQEICGAIEKLAEYGIRVDFADLELLLRRENDDIRKFSLALLSDSPDKVLALEVAKEIAATAPASSFATELALLMDLEGSQK